MEESEKIKLALTVIDKGLDKDELYYSDYLYGHEKDADSVWDYVEECRMIGTIAYKEKYGIE